MEPQLFTAPAPALADLPAGATIMVGGLQGAGVPNGLLRALAERGLGDLTLVCDTGDSSVLSLIAAGQVRKLVCPPLTEYAWQQIEGTGTELEIVGAGVLAERIRAAGAGIGAFLVEPHADEWLDAGEERQEIDGRQYLVETPLRADFALLRAYKADTLGNLIYQGTARNWNPNMATASTTVVVEVGEVVEPGEIDPEAVITPGIFVDRIVSSRLPTGYSKLSLL